MRKVVSFMKVVIWLLACGLAFATGAQSQGYPMYQILYSKAKNQVNKSIERVSPVVGAVDELSKWVLRREE